MSIETGTGPRTEAGKTRSSQNATKHGFFAGHDFIREGEEEKYATTVRYSRFAQTWLRPCCYRRHRIPAIPVLWVLTAWCLFVLQQDPRLDRDRLWKAAEFPHSAPAILSLLATALVIGTALVLRLAPPVYPQGLSTGGCVRAVQGSFRPALGDRPCQREAGLGETTPLTQSTFEVDREVAFRFTAVEHSADCVPSPLLHQHRPPRYNLFRTTK